MRLTVEPDETDKKLEEYRLVDLIGEGGLSKVFAWYDRSRREKVAVKVYDDTTFSDLYGQREV